jgi:DNA modification methylase
MRMSLTPATGTISISHVVIDPFLGSGSVLIAAEKTGRVCRGIELDRLYVDVIIRRYEALTRTTRRPIP